MEPVVCPSGDHKNVPPFISTVVVNVVLSPWQIVGFSLMEIWGIGFTSTIKLVELAH